MSLLAEVQVYELNSMIAFKKPADTDPFLTVPKCTVKVRPYKATGFLFEDIETKDDIVSVEEYNDVLDGGGAPYGVSRLAVYTALSNLLCTDAGATVTELQDIEAALGLTNFEMIPGNTVEITYYSGVVIPGNPSGNKNIQTVVYKTGATTVATKTMEYDNDDDTTKVTIT